MMIFLIIDFFAKICKIFTFIIIVRMLYKIILQEKKEKAIRKSKKH
ncbi:hypothetical protein GCM10011573_00760 [Enterococcus wangshanyuanii]|uniref:Uncharacterized protein n=1 Tax=Enterococcus wangshanyuanii TaxID=2005703 RepID=A0ABQ1NFC9_9ENTE|nr:hypothetical protein GCM10011573_00760 [Enterococcus wangshanyuanii]